MAMFSIVVTYRIEVKQGNAVEGKLKVYYPDTTYPSDTNLRARVLARHCDLDERDIVKVDISREK